MLSKYSPPAFTFLLQCSCTFWDSCNLHGSSYTRVYSCFYYYYYCLVFINFGQHLKGLRKSLCNKIQNLIFDHCFIAGIWKSVYWKNWLTDNVCIAHTRIWEVTIALIRHILTYCPSANNESSTCIFPSELCT